MTLLAYTTLLWLALCLFVIAISDRRRKPGMRPLIAPWLTAAVKLIYPVPLAAYAWALLHLPPVSVVDVVAGLLTLSGTVLTIKAKLDLGTGHSWAGTYRVGQTRTRRGLYGLLPHPMYTGILCVIIGGSIMAVSRLPAVAVAGTMAANLIIAVFLVVVAGRETALLPSPVAVSREDREQPGRG